MHKSNNIYGSHENCDHTIGFSFNKFINLSDIPFFGDIAGMYYRFYFCPKCGIDVRGKY